MHTPFTLSNRYYSLQYNCNKGEYLDFPLPSIPTVSQYKKYGTFIKHHTSRRRIL